MVSLVQVYRGNIVLNLNVKSYTSYGFNSFNSFVSMWSYPQQISFPALLSWHIKKKKNHPTSLLFTPCFNTFSMRSISHKLGLNVIPSKKGNIFSAINSLNFPKFSILLQLFIALKEQIQFKSKLNMYTHITQPFKRRYFINFHVYCTKLHWVLTTQIKQFWKTKQKK